MRPWNLFMPQQLGTHDSSHKSNICDIACTNYIPLLWEIFLNSCEVFGVFLNLVIMNCHYREFKIKTEPILVCAHISLDMKVSMFGRHTWRIRKTIRQFKLYPHENKNFQVFRTFWIFTAITLFIALSAKSLIIKADSFQFPLRSIQQSIISPM